MVLRQNTGRIRRLRVASQGEGLTAAASEVHGATVATPAWLAHPVLPAKRVEQRGALPDLLERSLEHVFARQVGQGVREVTRQGETVGRNDDVTPSPAAHARFRLVRVV